MLRVWIRRRRYACGRARGSSPSVVNRFIDRSHAKRASELHCVHFEIAYSAILAFNDKRIYACDDETFTNRPKCATVFRYAPFSKRFIVKLGFNRGRR